MLMRWRDYNRDFAAFDELRRQMNSLLAEMDQPWSVLGEHPSTVTWPPSNLYDTGSELVLVAATPGMTADDMRLDLMGDTITLTGLRKTEVPKAHSVHRQERGEIRFARSFSLPCKVDPERVSATVKNGLLTISMAKAPEAQPRQITVRAS